MNKPSLVTDVGLLRSRCEPVKSVAEGLEIARKLTNWLRRHNKWAIGKKSRDLCLLKGLDPAPLMGIGMAAPQLGIFKRVSVVLIEDKPLALVNPEFVDCSENRFQTVEGCLSLPGQQAQTWRHLWVTVRCANFPAKTFGLVHPEDFLRQDASTRLLYAVCVQHEVAHCFSKLITDFTTDNYPDPRDWEAW